ncbi:MAG: hypothetical protein U0269_14695 [Polyangiales bacterium]
MSIIRVDAPFIAPVPVGHRVTVLALDWFATPIALFGGGQPGQWQVSKKIIVCDENTRIVYAEKSTPLSDDASYEQLTFRDGSFRISQSVAPLRGVVRSCIVQSDHGDNVYNRTLLNVEPDAAPATP